MKTKKVIKRIFIFLAIWLITHSAYTIIDGIYDNKETADYAVVLGNKVNPDGTLSRRLEERMKTALSLYHAGRVKGVIVSGGLGKEGYYEAEKMKEYLVESGVPDSVIIADNDGNNSRKTVENTLSLQDSLHFDSLIIVSQYFHQTRNKMLFRKNGFQNVNSVSPIYFEWRDIYSLSREFIAFYIQLW